MERQFRLKPKTELNPKLNRSILGWVCKAVEGK